MPTLQGKSRHQIPISTAFQLLLVATRTITTPFLSNYVITHCACSIVTQVAAYIDLNTLHSLSLTCRQVRHNLLQYRRRLLQQTLHCENEAQNASLKALKPAGQNWHILGEAGHLVSGKVSQCARDLVDGCRRCGRVVCRVRAYL